jgi:hypothetical protein
MVKRLVLYEFFYKISILNTKFTHTYNIHVYMHESIRRYELYIIFYIVKFL